MPLVKGEISEKLAIRYSALLGHAKPAGPPGPASGRPRARQPQVGLLPQGRNRPDPDPQLGIRRTPDHRQVVGRTVLALRRHDRLGHGPPAVYPRPLPGSRPGRPARWNAGCSWSSRPCTVWRLCGTVPCWATSRAATSWRSCTPRCRGRRRAASSAPRNRGEASLGPSVRSERRHRGRAACWWRPRSWFRCSRTTSIISAGGATGPPVNGWRATPTRPSMVLDTRGWARFVSGQPGYDYWHVRQALTDSHLSYIIVGLDELEAQQPHAPGH